MWHVTLSRDAIKAVKRLPKNVQKRAFGLMKEIEIMGPVRGDWPNYGKLSENRHHCHIKKGRPTYVAVWRVIGPNSVEVTYVGTHERAPY